MLSRLGEIGGALSNGWITVWPTQLLALIWLAWVVSWVVAASWSARTKTHVRTRDSWVYRLPILLGAILLSPWTSQALGESRIYDPGDFGTYALAGLGAYRDQGEFPGAERVFERALALPFHTRLTDSDLDRVAAALDKLVSHH